MQSIQSNPIFAKLCCTVYIFYLFQIDIWFSVLQQSGLATSPFGNIPLFGFYLLRILYFMLQPLWCWCREMPSPWVALPAATTTSSPGGGANVRRITSNIPFLYFWIFIDGFFVLKISEHFFLFPGSAGFALSVWMAIAVVWKGRSGWKGGWTKCAPALGLNMLPEGGTSATVILT